MTFPRSLPPGLACYRRTAQFTRDNIPQSLLASHSVKPGVWGLLRVTRGRVRYCVDGHAPVSRVVAEGDAVTIAPETPHHVELLAPDSAFFIEFYRADDEIPPAAT